MRPENSQEQARTQVAVTKQVVYSGVQMQVQRVDDGSRQLQVLDPGTATLHVFPLDAETARVIGNALFSAVPIARPGEMPEAAA